MGDKLRWLLRLPVILLDHLWKYALPLALIPAAAYGVYRFNLRLFVSDLQQPQNELVVLTRNAPTTYYETRDGQYAGLEYDMVQAFAADLNIKVRFVVKDSVQEIFDGIRNNEGDFAAAGLAVTDDRRRSFRFSPSYQKVQTLLVCRRGGRALPTSLDDLQKQEIWVPDHSLYAELLDQLASRHDKLVWHSTGEWSTEMLLAKVWQKEVDCTVANSDVFALNQRYYPELQAVFPLVDDQPLAWVVNPQRWQLEVLLDDWFKKFHADGRMDEMVARYYGFLDEFDYVDTRIFQRRIDDLLPRYQSWFHQAARKQKLDWVLLAAISYQESHWNPLAKSPTGVRGIMMLTQTTARDLGVRSRLDARSNIFAGARHFADIRSRIPDRVPEPDRTWMALAAYNMGLGHVFDAQTMAAKMKKNPNRWSDVESVLPLLSEPEYYKELEHGYASGLQAMHYVRRVRDYQDMLNRSQQEKDAEKIARGDI